MSTDGVKPIPDDVPSDDALREVIENSPEPRQGVILVCYIGAVRDQVVYVIEGQSKPWKLRGQEGPIFETVEPGETSEEAVGRALKEELNLEDPNVAELVQERGTLFLDVNREKDHVIFKAKVFLVQLRTGTVISHITDGVEILERGLKSINSFNGNTRPGSILALQIATGAYRMPAIHIPFVRVKDGKEIQSV